MHIRLEGGKELGKGQVRGGSFKLKMQGDVRDIFQIKEDFKGDVKLSWNSFTMHLKEYLTI